MPKKAGKYILIAVGTLCVLICAACGVFLYQYYRGGGSEAALTQQVRPAPATPQPPQRFAPKEKRRRFFSGGV